MRTGELRQLKSVSVRVMRWLTAIVTMAAAVMVSSVTSAPPAVAAATSSLTNACLTAGQALSSPNREYSLTMQGDGNLVEYALGQAMWSTGTSGDPGAIACMQADANLVVYQSGAPRWASNSVRAVGTYTLAMQDDGNVVIYTSSGSPVWSIGPRSLPGSDFVNLPHRLCLDAQANGTTTNGDAVMLYSCWEGRNQKWVRVGNEIVNQAGGLCLDANAGGVSTNGDRVQLWGCNGGANQQWIPQGLNFVNQASGTCLDANAGTDYKNGTTVQLWSCGGQPNQKWIQGGEIVNQPYGLCLDAVANHANTNGDKVELYSCWGGANQQWVRRGDELRNQADGLCLDANGSTSYANGGAVQLYTCIPGDANQGWEQKGMTLVNEAYGLCLDAAAQTSANNGGVVQMWSCNGNTNQGWFDRDAHGPDFFSFGFNMGWPGLVGATAGLSVEVTADTTVYATMFAGGSFGPSLGSGAVKGYGIVGNDGTASDTNIDHFIKGTTYSEGATAQLLGFWSLGHTQVFNDSGAPGYQSATFTTGSGFGLGISGSIGTSCSIDLGKNYADLGSSAPTVGGWPNGGAEPDPDMSSLRDAMSAATNSLNAWAASGFSASACSGNPS